MNQGYRSAECNSRLGPSMRASCMIITTYSPLSHSKIPVSSIVAPCHSIVAPTENYIQSALKLHLRIHAMRAYHIVRKNWCDNRNFLLFEKKQGEKNGSLAQCMGESLMLAGSTWLPEWCRCSSLGKFSLGSRRTERDRGT